MKKIFYIALVLVALMVIGRLLNHKPIENATVEYQATIEKQPIVKEDANGNMTVDGEIVEDIEETNPSETSDEEETVISK